jgi:hypothetical protein
MTVKHYTSRGEVLAKVTQLGKFTKSFEVIKGIDTIEKARKVKKAKRTGKPYQQQMGRARGRGAGHIVPEARWQHILRDDPMSPVSQQAQGEEDVRSAIMRHGSVEQEEPILFNKGKK